VSSVTFGTPKTFSMRRMVFSLTPDRRASSSMFQRNAARAIRIWHAVSAIFPRATYITFL